MGAPWPLCEARQAQWRYNTSAVAALSVGTAAIVPAGKVWCVFGVGYIPSVAETKIISFEKINANAGIGVGLLNPVSMLLNPASATCIEQGMELFLLPGEYIQARRDSATAGSTMTIYMEFVEIDLPLYVYDEPQVVKRQERAISSVRQRLGGGMPSIVRAPSDVGGDRGGRGGPLEK